MQGTTPKDDAEQTETPRVYRSNVPLTAAARRAQREAWLEAQRRDWERKWARWSGSGFEIISVPDDGDREG